MCSLFAGGGRQGQSSSPGKKQMLSQLKTHLHWLRLHPGAQLILKYKIRTFIGSLSGSGIIAIGSGLNFDHFKYWIALDSYKKG